MDQEQILSQDSETAGSQQDETQKEKHTLPTIL